MPTNRLILSCAIFAIIGFAAAHLAANGFIQIVKEQQVFHDTFEIREFQIRQADYHIDKKVWDQTPKEFRAESQPDYKELPHRPRMDGEDMQIYLGGIFGGIGFGLALFLVSFAFERFRAQRHPELNHTSVIDRMIFSSAVFALIGLGVGHFAWGALLTEVHEKQARFDQSDIPIYEKDYREYRVKMQLWNEAPSEARGLPPFGPPSLSIRPSAEPKLAIQIFLLVVGGGSLVGVFIATLSIFFDRRLVAKGAA